MAIVVKNVTKTAIQGLDGIFHIYKQQCVRVSSITRHIWQYLRHI